MRLLLVEDDEMVASALGWALTDLGFELHVVDIPRQVIGAIAHIRPDAVILDINLRDTVDGLTLAKHIRDVWEELPIVLVSGHEYHDRMNAVVSHRKTAFLQKPYEIDALIFEIRKLAGLA